MDSPTASQQDDRQKGEDSHEHGRVREEGNDEFGGHRPMLRPASPVSHRTNRPPGVV